MRNKIIRKCLILNAALIMTFVFCACSKSQILSDGITQNENLSAGVEFGSKESVIDSIKKSFETYNTSIVVGATNIDYVYAAIDEIYDDPQYFWLGRECKIVSINGLNTLTFDKRYSKDIDAMKGEVDAVTEKIIGGIPNGADDFEKILYIHDYLCNNIVYTDCDEDIDSDIYAALVTGKCVCEGYADAFSYLLSKVGIENYFCSGDANDGTGLGPHAWNRVVIDGNSYYFDVTWDDDDIENVPSYSYFGVDSTTISKNHYMDEKHELVASDATEYNYYYHNGYVLDEYSEENFAEILGKQDKIIDVMCANDLTFWKLTEAMNSGNYIVKIMSLANKDWSYSNSFSIIKDEKARTVRLFVK